MTTPRPPDAPGRDIPAATREAVFARDAGMCRYCGQPGNTLDHVYPWIQGGDHDAHNLVVACSVDNSIAGQRVFALLSEKVTYVRLRRAVLGATRLRRLEALAAAGRPIGEWT